MDGEGPYSVGSHEVVQVFCAPNSRVCNACVAWLTDRLGLVSTGTHQMIRWENSAQCCLGHTEWRDSSKTHPAIPSVAAENTFNGAVFGTFENASRSLVRLFVHLC